MSGDVSVFAAKEPPPPVAELPEDWQGETLGTAAESEGVNGRRYFPVAFTRGRS